MDARPFVHTLVATAISLFPTILEHDRLTRKPLERKKRSEIPSYVVSSIRRPFLKIVIVI